MKTKKTLEIVITWGAVFWLGGKVWGYYFPGEWWPTSWTRFVSFFFTLALGCWALTIRECRVAFESIVRNTGVLPQKVFEFLDGEICGFSGTASHPLKKRDTVVILERLRFPQDSPERFVLVSLDDVHSTSLLPARGVHEIIIGTTVVIEYNSGKLNLNIRMEP